MGTLTQELGKKPVMFVHVPFPYDEELWGEARDHWERAGIFRSKRSELAGDIVKPRETVLYILAHSGQGVSEIASSDGDKLSASELVDYLIEYDLPSDILCLKIWACFSGVNGFAKEVKMHFLGKNKGYNPIVVGYNRIIGGPFDQGDEHKHAFQEGPTPGSRGPVIGRASANRTVFR